MHKGVVETRVEEPGVEEAEVEEESVVVEGRRERCKSAEWESGGIHALLKETEWLKTGMTKTGEDSNSGEVGGMKERYASGDESGT